MKSQIYDAVMRARIDWLICDEAPRQASIAVAEQKNTKKNQKRDCGL